MASHYGIKFHPGLIVSDVAKNVGNKVTLIWESGRTRDRVEIMGLPYQHGFWGNSGAWCLYKSEHHFIPNWSCQVRFYRRRKLSVINIIHDRLEVGW